MTNKEPTLAVLLRDEIACLEITLAEMRKISLQFDTGFSTPDEADEMVRRMFALADRHAFTSTEVETGKTWTESGLVASLESLLFMLGESSWDYVVPNAPPSQTPRTGEAISS
jgi:hypothetical protein